jgi:hypothetical protein
LIESKGYVSRTKTVETNPSREEKTEEATGEVHGFMNASSQMTSIEKEETYDLNDQSTMMKRLRR